MKFMKTLMTLAVAFAAFLIGCNKELPTPEKMKSIANAIGKTAGYACELSKTKTAVKEGIVVVLDTASKVVPGENQTFTEAWTPIVDAEVKKLVDSKKIDENGAAVAKIALKAATEGLDYVFVRYPKAKNAKELVSAAVEGFVGGYKSVVVLAGNATVDIDKEAYNYIKTKISASK